MPVSSYVLRCRRNDQSQILGALAELGSFQIGERSDDGMAVAIATESNEASEVLGRTLSELPGVCAAILVYHSVEDLQSRVPQAAVGLL